MASLERSTDSACGSLLLSPTAARTHQSSGSHSLSSASSADSQLANSEEKNTAADYSSTDNPNDPSRTASTHAASTTACLPNLEGAETTSAAAAPPLLDQTLQAIDMEEGTPQHTDEQHSSQTETSEFLHI